MLHPTPEGVTFQRNERNVSILVAESVLTSPGDTPSASVWLRGTAHTGKDDVHPFHGRARAPRPELPGPSSAAPAPRPELPGPSSPAQRQLLQDLDHIPVLSATLVLINTSHPSSGDSFLIFFFTLVY